MTDAPIVYLSTHALAPVRTSYQTIVPSLYIRCTGGSLEAYFNVETVTADESLEYRIDDEDPGMLSVSSGTDHETLFVSDYSVNEVGPAALLRQMIAGRRLRIRWTPYAESPVTADFSLSGIGAIAPRVKEAGCDYSAEHAKDALLNPTEAATGFTEPPSDTAWIGDLTVMRAYSLKCGNGKMTRDFARSHNFKVKYFAGRAAAIDAGFDVVDIPCR
jgi:hypothetical protein